MTAILRILARLAEDYARNALYAVSRANKGKADGVADMELADRLIARAGRGR